MESPKSSDKAEAGESRIRLWILGVVGAITPFLLLGVYYKTMFAGLINPDALDYAQIGRNLSEGRGFTTLILRPLALTHGNNALLQPDVTHGPLFPFVLSLAFDTFKANDTSVALVSGFFYLLTIPVIYLLGARMFSRTVGMLAAMVFTANALMLEYASSGLPISLEILLTTLLLSEVYNIAMYKQDQGDAAPLPKWLLMRAGALTGLLYLTNPEFICVLPIVGGVVLWLFPTRRLQSGGFFALAFSPVLLWMARNAALTGNPIFGLRGMDVWTYVTNYYPGEKVYRMAPSDVVPGTDMFVALVLKILSGLGNIVQQAPQVAASWVLAFFLPSLFFRFADTAANLVRSVTILFVLAIGILLLIFGVDMPLLTCVVPVLLIFAVAYLIYLGQQARLSRRGATLAVSLFAFSVIYPLVSTILLSGAQPAALKEASTARSVSKMMTQPDDVAFSDQPWIVAWYAHRPAMWVPADDNRVGEFRDRFNVRWMFLTDRLGAQGLTQGWEAVYMNFQDWDLVWQQRQQRQMPELTSMSINDPNVPLFAALKGFTVLPPLPNAPNSIVIANLPQTKQTASIPGLPDQTKQVAKAVSSPSGPLTKAPGSAQTR
jgi:hypothetical protein